MNRPFTLCCALCFFGLTPAFTQTSRKEIVDAAVGGERRIYPFWTLFSHPRFDYEVPVPPGVRAMGIPEKATEIRFVSEDGDFTMTAWGGLSPDYTPRVMESQWRLARSAKGRNITYQRKARSWFVVSGVDDNGYEFYQKFMAQGDQIATFTLTYPHSRLEDFDEWVTGIEDGFSIVYDAVHGPPELARAPARTDSPVPGTSAARRDGKGLEGDPFPRSSPPEPPKQTQRPGTADPFAVGPKVDLTPPGKNHTEPPEATRYFSNKTEKPGALKKPPQEKPPAGNTTLREDLPYGVPVAGKSGYLYSPYGGKSMVDAVGIPRGTKVKCPYTGKVFRVP